VADVVTFQQLLYLSIICDGGIRWRIAMEDCDGIREESGIMLIMCDDVTRMWGFQS
jgi:hypothetical protein